MDVGPALRGLVGILPKDAHSVIYRDSIGNISSSNLMHHKDRVRNSYNECASNFKAP